MFSSDVHIDTFCGPMLLFDGASCFLYRHIVPSVVIKGHCRRIFFGTTFNLEFFFNKPFLSDN